MGAYNSECKSNINIQHAATLTEIRQFQRAKERIDKAISRLGETIDHINKSFGPVLQPAGVCNEGCNEKKETPPQSDFEKFIEAIDYSIHDIAQQIDNICERSSV